MFDVLHVKNQEYKKMSLPSSILKASLGAPQDIKRMQQYAASHFNLGPLVLTDAAKREKAHLRQLDRESRSHLRQFNYPNNPRDYLPQNILDEWRVVEEQEAFDEERKAFEAEKNAETKRNKRARLSGGVIVGMMQSNQQN
jgi:hypothetical protein